MKKTVISVVTGANRGIGKAICESLATTVNEPFILYATSRKGLDLDILPSSKDTLIKYAKLDIADSRSIRSLADSISKDYGGLDVLINNAGANLDYDNTQGSTKRTLDINYRATLEMCRVFIPIMNKPGRIVNLSSVYSELNLYSGEIQQRFRNPRGLEDLENLIANYQECVNNGTQVSKGWGRMGAYGVSKAAINSFSAVLGRENPGFLINACCPGWVLTDMGLLGGGSSTPQKSPAEGATIPIRLGFKDIDGITGKYWANPSVSSKGEGQVMDW